jgi:hypothetical protein
MSGEYVFSRISGFDQEGNFDEAMLAHPDFRPHSAVDGFSETFLTLMPDGAILAVLRQQGVGNGERLDLYCCLSTDGGDTWSQYERMDICGMSPCLHLSPYGCLILAYRRCAASGSLEGKSGVALSWREDNGMTWQDELVLVDPNGYQYTGEYQAGYPTLINLDSDDILVIFYSYNPLPPQRRYLAANLIREIG